MDRAQKEKVVEELGQIFESSGVVVVARYDGMTVAQMQDLRAEMRSVGGSVRVAKNRLAKIALDGKPCESIGKLLTGMTVLTYSEDPVAAAKIERPAALVKSCSVGSGRPSKAFSVDGGANAPRPSARAAAKAHAVASANNTRRLLRLPGGAPRASRPLTRER